MGKKFTRKISAFVFALLFITLFLNPARATTSSINPTIPAQNSPLLSSVLRAQFLAAYNDITALFGDFTVGANQVLGSIAGGTAGPITVPNCSVLGFNNGFICASGTGISSIVGDVNASGTGTVTATLSNTTTARNNIGLGTASTPAFAGLALSGVENINLNSGALLAALTGTIVHSANANATISRYQLDAFGAASHFSAVRYDGTAAAPTTIQSADIIGSFNGWGYDGTALGAGGSYQLAATQAWTPSAHGANASIWTTPNGTTTPLQQVIVNHDGGVTVGSPTGGDQGAGTLNATGLFVNGSPVTSGAVSLNLGSITTANPHISGDVTSGFYSAGAALVDIGISGVKVAEWGTGGTVLQGTTTANNLTVTGTCTGCGGGTPAGTDTALQYKNGSSLAGATALFVSTTRKGLDTLATVTTSNLISLGNATGTDTTSIAIGPNADLVQTSTGNNNIAIGLSALTSGTTATGNVAVGVSALSQNQVSASNTAIGYQALKVEINNNNTAVGYQALVANSNASQNTAVGAVSLQGSTGGSNTALGYSACGGSITGSSNTCLGEAAGDANITGSHNILIGDLTAFNKLTSGSSNILMGPSVGTTTLTTGSSNILLGVSSGVDTPAAGTTNYLNIGNMITGDMSKGILIFRGTTTALGTCGTSSTLKAGSNDMSGEVTVAGSSASCALNFANTHTAAPNCIVTEQGTTAAFGYSSSTTALTVVATSLTGVTFDYFCPTGATSTNPTP